MKNELKYFFIYNNQCKYPIEQLLFMLSQIRQMTSFMFTYTKRF
jgi:hypothetical protein